MVLSCKNIRKSFGIDEVLKDVTFLLEEGEKAAIVGVNGAGKTTLLKIITGETHSDGGDISFKKGIKIGYLSQMMGVNPDNTIENELLEVFSSIIAIEKEMRATEKAMNEPDADSVELEEMLERYTRLSHRFESSKGYEYESRVRGVIKGLGFTQEDSKRTVATLSGGQKTRVALGKLLLSAPDLLLLDEPTNHLDIESVQWLEDVFLKNYESSVLIVSHDRYFLDKTATKIIEIENGKTAVYNGGYSYYAAKKENDRAIALKHYVDQQREIKRQEEVIKRLKSFNREKSIRAAESKEKRLAKMERLEKPEDLPDKIRIIIEPRKKSGNDVLAVNNLKKSFGSVPLFSGISFEIKRGETVALIGPNGIGKTTLFKMILESAKNIRLGTNVEIGYFDQEYLLLNDDKTIFDEISDDYPTLKSGEIRNTLAAFVFTGDDVFKPIGTLSGGEKGRVALAKLMLSSANFLLLDEPTNHLDVFSKEILEDALKSYTGTILYISHDRYFINNTADKILEMGSTGITQYLGDYTYYAEKKLYLQSLTEPEEPVRAESRKQAKSPLFAERKKRARLEKLENEISLTESKIAALDAESEREDVYTDAEKSLDILNRRSQLVETLNQLYDDWHNSYE